jgi:hypothetical protein
MIQRNQVVGRGHHDRDLANDSAMRLILGKAWRDLDQHEEASDTSRMSERSDIVL